MFSRRFHQNIRSIQLGAYINMADAIFDKDGKITNRADLTADEIADAYEAKNKDVFNRALTAEEKEKKALADAEQAKKDLAAEKEKASKPVEKPEPQSDPDELRLLARGLSDEEIDEAKSIAKGKGISLTEAIKTTSFKLFQDNLKEEQRKEKAKLGASSGSDKETENEIEVKPGMTTEEHREIWKKAKAGLGK